MRFQRKDEDMRILYDNLIKVVDKKKPKLSIVVLYKYIVLNFKIDDRIKIIKSLSLCIQELIK